MMGMKLRRAGVILAGAALVVVCVKSARLRAENGGRMDAARAATEPVDQNAAAKRNSVGVAYMGQQRFGDAQKEFDAALAADGNYALAKLNLGISLMAQQKSEAALAGASTTDTSRKSGLRRTLGGALVTLTDDKLVVERAPPRRRGAAKSGRRATSRR